MLILNASAAFLRLPSNRSNARSIMTRSCVAGRAYRRRGAPEAFPRQSHGRRTQDDDTPLVQPDDPFIRAEVQQFREMQVR